MAYPVSDTFRQAVRNGVTCTYSFAASVGGVAVPGAQDLRPTGGSITDTTKPGVRRVANLELAPFPGLFDLLEPSGTVLRATASVRFTDRSTVTIPMGVFSVDMERTTEGAGGLSLTAPDKWSLIQRARFIRPQQSIPGLSVTGQIAVLIRGALGLAEQVKVTATSAASVGALTWEKDRDKAINELAVGIGAWVYFDRDGLATIADLPTSGASADWLVDASPSGVLTDLQRERSRGNTYNVVVVESSSVGDTFPTQVVWDDDPQSPTYAGPDPINSPELAGPFGIATYYFDTPLPLTDVGAKRTGITILARVSGLAKQASIGQIVNPAVDSFDTLDLLPPLERSDIPRVLERHVADTVTHPLSVTASQRIEGRSTRLDDFT